MPTPIAPAAHGSAVWILVGLLVAGSLLLFVNLGHYALWDDEAGTALTAKSIVRTGDTTAFVDDHNIFAYREGFELKDLKLRYLPPLPAYLVAGAFSLLNRSDAFVARLPFALAGLATLGVIAWWARQAQLSGLPLLLLSLGIVTNASLFLYLRQCRYYAVALFCSVLLVYLYRQARPTFRSLLLFSAVSSVLFASNYLNYAALYACFAVDYLVWQRREAPLRPLDWCIVVIPQAIVCGAIAVVWNPLGMSSAAAEPGSLVKKLTLFLWQWRDLNRCEFLCGGLLVWAAIVAIWRRDRGLSRGLVALLVYVTCVTALSPQSVDRTFAADVRYLAPVIPLCILLAVRSLVLAAPHRPALALPIACVAFGSNLLHGGPLLAEGTRSTIVRYVAELHRPPSDPYSAAAAWCEKNVRPGQSVWVLPEHMTYPLMFHFPAAIYAWQLPAPPSGQFKDLPKIHFKGMVPPDFVLVFGSGIQQVAPLLQNWRQLGVPFGPPERLGHFGQDLYRPELMWRRFSAVTAYDPNTQDIYVFRRQR